MQQYPQANTLVPLIEKGITKDNCAAIVLKAGIKLPEMYLLGYGNNNCIGCVKGGKGYWNKIRTDFPETFSDMAKAEREVGHSCINGTFLDELNPTAGNKLRIVTPDCGTFCEIEFADLPVKELDAVMAGKVSIYKVA